MTDWYSDLLQDLSEVSDQCSLCPNESEIGCHRVNEKEIIATYYCQKCYNKIYRKSGRPKNDT